MNKQQYISKIVNKLNELQEIYNKGDNIINFINYLDTLELIKELTNGYIIQIEKECEIK